MTSWLLGRGFISPDSGRNGVRVLPPSAVIIRALGVLGLAMSGSIRDEMLKIFPTAGLAESEPVVEPSSCAKVPTTRAAHPPVRELTVQEAFNRYCTECVGKDLIDPRGISVSLLEENFPKLIKLYTRPTKAVQATKARAKHVLPSLREGTFDPDLYTWHMSRLDALFWISDVITDPDGIYPNKAPLIDGNEVYAKRYAKIGSELKLVFIATGYAGQRIVITSFLERHEGIIGYCGMPALYERP